MADLFSPMKFDEAQCKVKAAGTGDAIDPKHIAVDPSADNIITNDPQTGLKVVAEDFISAEEGNIAKKSLADGGILVKATDMVSDAECNALSVTNDGKLALIPEDLISDVMGGNPLGINPDDCKLYINPCLLPGPQNIVSKDEDNLIVEDPEDCSALLKYRNVVSEDAGNLIQPGTDGKLMVDMQYMVDRGYYGAGLVYVEKQDGSHVLQVAACDGLKFEEGDVTDTYGNTYHAKWLVVNLDESQNILYFKDADGCTECFTDCKQLSLEFSLDATGTKLRILDRNGTVYRQINLSNGLQGDGNGGLTINTLDSLATTAPNNDLPVSSKAVKEALDGLRDELIPHAHATTKFGAGTDTLYGHVKLSDATNSNLGVGDGTAATPKAVKKAYDDGTRTGNGTTQGQVKLSASHTSDLGVNDGTAATPSAVKKAYDDGTRTGNSATQGQVKLSDATDSNLGVSDGTAATPKAVKKAYDDGTRKGTCSQFGQVKLTDSLTSTDGCADSIGLSAAAGKQLKDMIDAIGGGGGFLGEPLIIKRFDTNNDGVYGVFYTPNGGSNVDYYLLEPSYIPSDARESSDVWNNPIPLDARETKSFGFYRNKTYKGNVNVSAVLGSSNSRPLMLIPSVLTNSSNANYRTVSFIYACTTNVLNKIEISQEQGSYSVDTGFFDTGFYDAPQDKMYPQGYLGLADNYHNLSANELDSIANILNEICGNSGVPVDVFAGSFKTDFPDQFTRIKAVIESSKARASCSVWEMSFGASVVTGGPDNNRIYMSFSASGHLLRTLRCLAVPANSKFSYPSSW